MTRELLQQALDALLHSDSPSQKRTDAIAALREALAAPQPEPVPEPYLCIKPACGADCNICNQALSPQEVRNYAIGYAILRNAPIDAIKNGGVFAGRTPDNVVINGADLDAATFGAAAQQSIDQQVESINAVFEAWRNGEDASMTLALAAPPAAPAPAVPEVMAGPMPPMSEADEKRLNAALTIVFDLACGPADPTMMQDELVAAAESIGMRFPAPAVPLAKSRAGSVYLAGPMTGYKNFNFPAFNAAAEMLRSEGLRVVNPADHGVVPDATWEDYLRYDIAKLAGCESIALLPGWSKSKGARLEFHISQALGMPIKLLGGAESATPAVPRHVRKIGGSFQHTGTVVADFKTTAGEPRIVLEFDAPVAGMLHVYRPDQVEPCESAASAVPDLKHCACEFDGDTCITQCKLHAAHVDALREWADRAKEAEAKLSAAPAVPPGMALVPINELSRLRKHAGFNVVELAYEQRESPGPFVGLAGTTNVMFAEQAHGIGGGGNG